MKEHEKRIREAVASGENFSDNDLRALLADLDAMRGALEGAYSLAIGHAATYKFQHELEDVHPTHQAILDAARAALKGAEA